MEASVANEQHCKSICLSHRSCQHTPPLLVQRALVLGACSQEAEGRAGKARSPDSVIRMADVMHAQLVIGDTGFHTGVQASAFRSKVGSIHPPSGATRTSIGDLQSKSGRTCRESELPRLGHSYGRRHARATCRCIPAPFVWKPVSTTSSAGQESAFRAEVVSIRPPSGAMRTSIGGLQSRSGRTGRESTLFRLDHS